MRNEDGIAIIYCQYYAFLLPYHVIEAESVERARIRINGIVQGVGFRPFIHRLVSEHGLNGMIRNSSSGVEISSGNTTVTTLRSGDAPFFWLWFSAPW